MSTMSNLQQEEGLMCAGIFELCMYDNTTCNNECTSNILPSLFNWQLTEYSCIHYSVCSNLRSVGIWSSFHCYLFLLGASSSSVYMANTKFYLKHWLCAKEQGFISLSKPLGGYSLRWYLPHSTQYISSIKFYLVSSWDAGHTWQYFFQ